MSKIITNFGRYSDSELAVMAQHIVDSLTANAAFPTPVPALEDVQTILDSYTTALAQVGSGGRALTVIKNQRRKSLEILLSPLGIYVQLHSNNNMATMLSSGFPITKTPTPVGVLAKPENLRAVPGIAGEIKLSVFSVAHAKAYLWQYRLTTDTVWTDMHTTKAKADVAGLTPGQQYSFRVTGLGTNPTQNWSDEVRSFVV